MIWLLIIFLVLYSPLRPSQAYFLQLLWSPCTSQSYQSPSHLRTFVFSMPSIWKVLPNMFFLFVESFELTPQKDLQGLPSPNTTSLFTPSLPHRGNLLFSQHLSTQHLLYAYLFIFNVLILLFIATRFASWEQRWFLVYYCFSVAVPAYNRY